MFTSTNEPATNLSFSAAVYEAGTDEPGWLLCRKKRKVNKRVAENYVDAQRLKLNL
jgi:hypothetical protein